MLSINLSDAKDKLSQIVKDTAETMEPVLISVHGKKEVILISVEEYNSLKQTIELLKDSELMKRLILTMTEISKNKVVKINGEEAKE